MSDFSVPSRPATQGQRDFLSSWRGTPCARATHAIHSSGSRMRDVALWPWPGAVECSVRACFFSRRSATVHPRLLLQL